jgi:uncharacterized membrane protein
MSNSRSATLKSRNHEISVAEHESDSPILPAAQLERLHNFRPDLVDWTIKQTELESSWRRSETHRVNTFIFIERLLGQIGGMIIGFGAIAGGIYASTHGSEAVGVAIATVGLGTLAVVFLTGRSKGKTKSP